MYHNKRYSMKEIHIGVKGGSKWNRRINCVLKNRKPQTATNKSKPMKETR